MMLHTGYTTTQQEALEPISLDNIGLVKVCSVVLGEGVTRVRLEMPWMCSSQEGEYSAQLPSERNR